MGCFLKPNELKVGARAFPIKLNNTTNFHEFWTTKAPYDKENKAAENTLRHPSVAFEEASEDLQGASGTFKGVSERLQGFGGGFQGQFESFQGNFSEHFKGFQVVLVAF